MNGEKADKELRLGYSSGDSLDDNFGRRRHRRNKDSSRSSTNSSSVSTPDQESLPAGITGTPDSTKDVSPDYPTNVVLEPVPTEKAQKDSLPEAGVVKSHVTDDAPSNNEVQIDAALPSDHKPLDITSEPEDKPDSEEADVTKPAVTEPDVTEPDVTEPDVTEPDATEPAVTEPDITKPDATEPDVTEPDVTEPDVTEPDATEPNVTEPDATEPAVMEAEATVPCQQTEKSEESDESKGK